MKNLAIDALAGVAFLAAAVLFLVGVRTFRARRRGGWTGEFLLALAAALSMISDVRAQDPVPAEKRDEVDARAKEVEKTAEWKKMRKFFRKLSDALASDKKIEENPRDEAAKLAEGTKRVDGKQGADAALLTVDEALGECAEFLLTAAYHVWRTKGAGARATCYDMVMPQSSVHLPEQRALLKKQLEEGKIPQEVYDRICKVLDETGNMNSILEGLNARNTALVFRLLRDMAGARAVEIPKIAPEVEKRLAELIEELGAEEIEKRAQAQAAIVEIGEGAIPLLRKALEHKDSEVRARAKAILEELE